VKDSEIIRKRLYILKYNEIGLKFFCFSGPKIATHLLYRIWNSQLRYKTFLWKGF